MKYEAVFGPQYWFNTGPEDAEFIGESTEHKKYFYKNIIAGESYEYFNTKKKTWVKSGGYTANLFLAARRVVEETPKPEPKRWTVEDQKAGRLPEVGAEVQFNFYQSAVVRQVVIKYLDDQVAVIQTEDVTRPFCYETCKVVFTPIETPEEKAERLRSEWVELAFDNMMRKEGLHSTECLDRIKCHFGSAYDALLSGALSAPTKGSE